LIKHAAKTGLPIIFDFVDNTVEEMDKAIKTAINNGASGVIINYHPGKNPAKPEEHNLRLIKTYKKYFGVPIGISCHYKGDEILYASVGMGVNIIEKGVFDNPDKNEQNVISAAALDDLKNMINKVNNCSKALGNSKINIKDSELRDQTLQYGLVAKTDINEGESLTQNNVRFAFPCVGISVEDWESIEGRPAKRNIKEDNEITLEDI
jgi:sialic acid synthase SpsE